MNAPVPVIAIDGPSASGKGTVAARVAVALGFHLLDSGALYRLVALDAARRGVDWDDAPGLAKVAATLPVRFEADAIYLGDQEVSLAIRSEAISAGASRVAAIPALREALTARQRAFRRPPGLVADGRDMGSVIFPDAVLKVFLTASVEVRAERRHKQLMEKGLAASIAPLLQELRERDARDAARSVAPLRKCDDALLLDTSGLAIEEAVAMVLAWARERLPDGVSARH